jgi:hypothetical protein
MGCNAIADAIIGRSELVLRALRKTLLLPGEWCAPDATSRECESQSGSLAALMMREDAAILGFQTRSNRGPLQLKLDGGGILISDWARHTPPEVLPKNWEVPVSALDSVYTVPPDGRYIFQADVPASLADDVRSPSAAKGKSPGNFSFLMSMMEPTRRAHYGEVRIVDSRNFRVSNSEWVSSIPRNW